MNDASYATQCARFLVRKMIIHLPDTHSRLHDRREAAHPQWQRGRDALQATGGSLLEPVHVVFQLLTMPKQCLSCR
jgi:hypothetical protein